MRKDFINFVLLGVLALQLQPAAGKTDSYSCNGIISSRPCPETLQVQKLIVDETEEVPTPVPTGAPQLTPTSAPPRDSPPRGANYQIRTRNMKRPDPTMDWRVERVDRFSTRFSGKLTGSGEVEIAVAIIERQDSGSMKYRPFQSQTYRLPDEGGTKNFDFKVRMLAPQLVWALVAKNKGRWQGYYDLNGCCADNRAKAKCGNDGVVLCGASPSAACRCGG